ncbi:MAG TPA: tyrosine--tRNA ligase [Acidimicrobiales bacterium]
MVSLLADLQFRGLVHQVSDDALADMLNNGHLTAYIGFDPTSDSLQIGNLLQLCNLRRLQLAGHQPIVLAGGATGMIGDPGGKSEERNLLDRETVAANLEGMRPQLERFIDFSESAGRARGLVLDNADWLGTMTLIDYLRDVGKHFTVNQMIAKDTVKSRLDRPEQGISYAEFSYMLLQATDFLHLFDHFGCTLQMGASDQWGNITMGVELIRRTRQESAYAMTSPLVLRADGTKFGKSESGALYLSPKRTSPWTLYQYFVRVEDSVVGTYLRYFTFLSHDELLALDAAVTAEPAKREAQRRLAHEVVAMVHSPAEVARVEAAAEALYSEDVIGLDEATLLMVFEDAPSSQISKDRLSNGGIDLVELIADAGLVGSRSQARTTIEQGGLYVNNRRVDPAAARISAEDLLAGGYVLLRRGRRDFHLLRCQ